MKDFDRSKNFKDSFILIGLCLLLFLYLLFVTDKMPYMDYWNGMSVYIPHVLNDPVNLNEIFHLPHILHWNPLYSLVDYIYIRVFKFNNQVYIFSGMAFSFIIFYIIYRYYHQNFRPENKKLLITGLLIYMLMVFNLNQWEILTMSCILPFMFRIMIYILCFMGLDRLLKKDASAGKYICCILFGISNMIIIFLISQAYYPGFASAIIGACLLELILIHDKKNIFPCIFIILCNALGTAGCYLTTDMSTTPIAVSSEGGGIIEYIKGFLIMLGGTITPTFVLVRTHIISYIIGTAIFILVVYALILYFSKKQNHIAYFPVMCLIYAFVSIVIIIMGRLKGYGLESLGTSRYVVDTTLGLLGLVHIFMTSYQAEDFKNKRYAMIILALGAMVFLSSCFELAISPFRRQYYHSLVEMAENPSNYSDEDLSSFQADPQEVRKGIETLKEYKLCIWSD